MVQAQFTVRLHNQSRSLLPATENVLFSFRRPADDDWTTRHLKANIIDAKVDFRNDGGDKYAVVVSRKHFSETGFFPVKVDPAAPVNLDLMLLPRKAGIELPAWDSLEGAWAKLHAFLAGGNPALARRDYDDLCREHPKSVVCLLNLAKGIELLSAALNDRDLLPLFRRIELVEPPGDECRGVREDRFFAFADEKLLGVIREHTDGGRRFFEAAPSAAHKCATVSFKEKRFGEANLQFTFDENRTAEIEGAKCLLVDVDMDYYDDTGAHVLLELIPNTISKWIGKPRRTDPLRIYAMRWVAGRMSNPLEEFDPPYRLLNQA
jgi:hypothetical protein